MTPRLAILAFAVAAAMVYGLYEVEHAVRGLDRKLVDLQSSISQEREAIRVLSAEWSYLTQPARLQDLVSRYGELQLLTPEQTTTAAAFFAQSDVEGEAEAVQAEAPLPAAKPPFADTRVTYVRGGGDVQ